MVSGRINISYQLSAIILLLVMFFCGIAHARTAPQRRSALTSSAFGEKILTNPS